ncbi:MAG: NAD+ synthase [Bacteroidetes bacterium]|jgi:NAD+ synthase (glutamine-hydrolysing)|nr:NAD+ synthase [Bacteroidota bacterium]
MQIALAQTNFHVGNFEQNTQKITDAIARAEAAGADLIVFPELAVTAYPPLDFLEFDDFIERCNMAIEKIAASCTHIAAIVGCPSRNPVLEGKNLFNSAYFIHSGKVQSIVHKALLPTYDIFDEYRYFEPGRNFECISFKGQKIALTICEDLWNVEDDPMYIHSPMEELIKEKPSLIINIAASPFDYEHAQKRKAILLRNVKQYKLPLIYVNHVGAQTEIIFDGGSLAFNAAGELIHEGPYFEEKLILLDTEKQIAIQESKNEKYELIYRALTLGIKDYFSKMGFTKAILGLSGGVDSALVTVLAGHVLGPENILPVMLPSAFSSSHSVSDSEELCRNMGIKVEKIEINSAYESMIHLLKPLFGNRPFDVTEENLQARIRGNLLMALSNKFGHILLNTSNKSEIAVGYGTLYGDMCGGLSVIGDLYKTEVYQLCEYINREKEIIPRNIITKAPSAELRPGQKDSDSLPPYEVLDKILYDYIELRKGPARIIAEGHDEQLVHRVLKMVNRNEYKRRQLAPVLRVSTKAFGFGRRMPVAGKYLS